MSHHLRGYQGERKRLPNGTYVKHGYGVMRFSTGAVYKGEWKHDRMWGIGEYTWNDGNMYRGEFRDGKQEGFGRYDWPTGGYYVGQWYQDRMSGHGEYVRADKVRYVGNWKDDTQFGLGHKIVPERIAYGSDRTSSVERVFEEYWGAGKVLQRQKEVLIHPGGKMHCICMREAFIDSVVSHNSPCSPSGEQDQYLDIHRLKFWPYRVFDGSDSFCLSEKVQSFEEGKESISELRCSSSQ